MTDGNGRDTDKSELGNEGDRETPVLPPLTLEALAKELQGALAESNALSILSREASEKSASLCLELLQRLRGDELRTADVMRRVDRIEQHVGLAAE